VGLEARRHHHGDAVEQLVAAIGAVVPLQELGERHALGGGGGHELKVVKPVSGNKPRAFRPLA
jgi:hypothetical protein